MIGPLGYGDAHFVAADQAYDYTIRFENDPNATAPAQIVVVTHIFDRDLDIRTFRLGPLGFGSFTREISYNTAILQVSSYLIFCDIDKVTLNGKIAYISFRRL